MECREFREIADSYLSDELTVESNHEAMSHVERCAGCRSELSARRVLRSKLRAAFIGLPDNHLRPEFMNDLSARLPEAELVSTKGAARLSHHWLLAVAACLLVAAAIGVLLVRQQLQRPANSAQIEHPIDIVKKGLARAAVDDHRDCAVHFRLPEKPIALEVAARQYDQVYFNLARAIVTEAGVAPPGVYLVEAHSCVIGGRRFAHLVLKYHDTVVSILVTDIAMGDENRSGHPSRFEEPASILCSQIKDYNVAFFPTARHAVFVVSALPEGENLALTRVLAPGIFAHIRKGEGVVEASALPF